MNKIKKTLFTISSSVILIAPLGAVAHAQVAAPQLRCQGFNSDQNLSDNITKGCDLAVDKKVSVNGGTYQDADTSATAAQGHVGDTVTYQITVTNMSSEEMTPLGKVVVHDVLPAAGVAFDSYVASTGTYDGSDWTFDLTTGDESNLDATLTITAHSTAVGMFQNTATLAQYDACGDGCPGFVAYSDSEPSNDSNDAWYDPSGQPQVLAGSTSTLTDTGSGTAASLIAGGLIVSTLGVAYLGRRSSKNSAEL